MSLSLPSILAGSFRAGKGRKCGFGLLAALAVCLSLPGGALAEEEPVTIGNQPTFGLNAPFSPERLSSRETLPVSLTLRVQVERGNYVGPLPGISGILFRLDRAFTVDVGAGARCGPAPNRRSGCRDVIARGSFLVAAEETTSEPNLIKGRSTLRVGGGKRSQPVLELVLPAPIQERFEVPMRFGPSHDPAIPGTQIELTLPPSLDGGAATVRALSVTFPASRARDVSPVISARCPKDGHSEVFAEAKLDDEEVHAVDLKRLCR